MPERLSAHLKALLLGACGLFVLLAFATYVPADLPVFSSPPNAPIHNLGGIVGAWLALAGRGGAGYASLVLPVLIWLIAVQVWQQRSSKIRWAIRAVACLGVAMALGVLATLVMPDPTSQAQAGGMIGYVLAHWGRYYLGGVGTALLASLIALCCWMLAVDHLNLPQGLLAAARGLWSRWRGRPSRAKEPAAERKPAAAPSARVAGTALPTVRTKPEPARAEPADSEPGGEPEPAGAPAVRIRSTVAPKPKVLPTAPGRVRPSPEGFVLPSLDLLMTPPPVGERQLTEDLQLNARVLEETLRDFGLEATCVNIDRGPAVTRYELSPAPGVKIQKIVSLSDDIAMVLKAASCHIVAPIPGKGLVGVEVSNSTATTVYLKELIASRAFQELHSPLSLAIGKDVSGQPVVFDLRDCPHLLIAGATGSGKTVCLNALLTGIMYQASPDEVKFLMIDPKMVELVLMNSIPHLVAPVITGSKRASSALGWAVQEMERRYQQLSEAGARNITGYNQKIKDGTAPPDHAHMPYLVIVIDELADLMMVSQQDVEHCITRLSQLSRAVGIHIILATQRPSVDVITGVIKANFPARIAFQVASKVDSRTILDGNGADKLLGRGDLLFLKPGAPKPVRAQGALVTDAELEKVVTYLKEQRPPSYDGNLVEQQQRPVESLDAEKDEMYIMAKRLVIDTQQASTSLLQRRLRLGYGRAARILDMMEQEGVVGPPQGSRPREVLIKPQTVEQS